MTGARLRMPIVCGIVLLTAGTLAADPSTTRQAPSCDELPFVYNRYWTTDYGPAQADVMTQPATGSTEMLKCPQTGVDYALCYYSGPATGDPALPCKVDEVKGVAYCECYPLTTTDKIPYYVDVNAILNLCVYLETIRVCGQDGSGCAGPNAPTPPVCSYIADNTLMPGADLISTFSLAKASEYGGANACTSCNGVYAGCMTAKCKWVEGQENVVCECPLYRGPYQVGQNGVSCDAGDGYVWSAAYNTTTSIDDCPSGMPQPGS